MIRQFPSSVCHKSIGHKENSIFCDLCKLWVHIKCNNFNFVEGVYQAVMILGIVLIVTLKYMLLAI